MSHLLPDPPMCEEVLPVRQSGRKWKEKEGKTWRGAAGESDRGSSATVRFPTWLTRK